MGSDAVVVTGASTGIGRACALDLARRGLHVFAGVRAESDGAALEAAARGRLTPLFLDVTDEAQIYAAAKSVEAEVGPRGLRGVVNNAGVALAAPLELVELDELRHQLEVNVVGAVAVTQAFLPAIRRAVGRVVFVGMAAIHVIECAVFFPAIRRAGGSLGSHLAQVFAFGFLHLQAIGAFAKPGGPEA